MRPVCIEPICIVPMYSNIFLNVGMEMDSLLDPVIDSSHRSYFTTVEHRALEVLHPRPPGETISIHHDWCDSYVMKYYCLSLMYSSVFLCFYNFVYCRLWEAGLLTLGRLVEDGPIQLYRSLLTAVLAVTYRGLCDGCMKTHGNAILAGCLSQNSPNNTDQVH